MRFGAAQVAARIAGRPTPGPFRYRDWGSLATVGRSHAVADFGRIRLTGLPAWLLWSTAHIYFLVDFRSRFVVGVNWLWSYLTFRRGARLITGLGSADRVGVAPDAALPPLRRVG